MAEYGAGWMLPSHGMEAAREQFEIMRRRIECGGRVIIGTEEALDVGTRIIEVEQGEAVVLRRATREEFVQASPVKIEERAPFYYELVLRPWS
jgi:hypothetical protein